jgi:hypothetical protein
MAYDCSPVRIGGELARKNNMAARANLAIELDIEDKGIVVLSEKKSDNGNDVDDINGFNFATQWHISDKTICDGGSRIDENCNGIQKIALKLFKPKITC